MEMSLGYLEETAAHLERVGFEVKRSTIKELTYVAHRFEIIRPDIFISIEHLDYEDVELPEKYWVHIENYFGLCSMPFEMDSWKYRDTKTEFRFYARADGTALTFSLIYARLPGLGQKA